MRFTAIFALVASASAMRLNLAEEQCVDTKTSDAIFHAIDTSDDGFINRTELVNALDAYAKSRNY